MKRNFMLFFLLIILSGCVYSDFSDSWNHTDKNIGTITASGSCSYFLGLQVSEDCYPNKIAEKNGIKTITSVDTKWTWLWLLNIRHTTVYGN